MADDDNEMTAQFVSDSVLTLERVEKLIRDVTSSDNSAALVTEFTRAIRAIKEPSLFHDLPILYDVAKATEGLLDGMRPGRGAATPERLQVLVTAYNFLKSALSALSQGSEESTYCEDATAIVNRIEDSLLEFSRPGPRITLSPPEAEAPAGVPSVRFAIDDELLGKFAAESEEHIEIVEQILLGLEDGNASPEATAEAFRAMHSLKGNSGIVGLAEMEELAHVLESTMLVWTKGPGRLSSAKISALLDALDALRNAVKALPAGGGKIPAKAGLIRKLDEAASVLPGEPGTRRKPRGTSEPPEPIPHDKQDAVEPTKTADSGERASSTIRVDTRKLDELMNLVGELIIAETTVTHNPDLEGHDFENFQKAALNLARVTRMLQDVTMQARMVPIESTFKKMARLVRDVAKKQRKEVRLISDGEETEVDKSVIEIISDPLVHLMRNAVDHGLESPETRESLGKPRIGQLRIDARQQSGEIVIRISDDGRGIDPEKLLASARKKGLTEVGRTYTRQEILSFIFAPGFSTAEKLTEISGRGVGMDVVKRNVERVNGRIEIDTTIGVGTTFTLRIPLTLAIIEGMLVRVGASFYTIPLLAIRESVKASASNLTRTSSGYELLRLRDEHFPIVKLRELLGSESGTGSIDGGILVLVEAGAKATALLVDEIVGQRQTVIKPLPEYLRETRVLAGCSILHNGQISLILDIDALARTSESEAA